MRWQPRHTMYLAASLSAWGDRMWTFAVGLYMVYATPNSLRLTALYGLVISVSVIVLGAPVGRWVDHTARLRAAQLSLVVQNVSVCTCAVILIVGLQYADYTASTWNSWLQTLLQVLVILVADVAAAGHRRQQDHHREGLDRRDVTRWMNSAFRTIDQGTYILAPVLVGQLMTFLSPVVAAAFMAAWNVVSLAAEYALLRVVYRSVPQLAQDKQPPPPPAACCGLGGWCCQRLQDMGQGWSAYFRSSFCLAGLALASLYMTVLGFDNITAGYGYSQGLTESTLSLLTAAGAVAGICGSLCFPKLRSVVGPTLAGVIGFSLAVLAQTLSLTSVFLPGTAFAPLARSGAPHTHTSVITLFSGIILARCGLWISDLSVTQLLQERVPEWRRGTISGVQSALNMTMDTAKNLLVVFIPHAQDFGVLIILSYIFWVIGWCLFAVYAATTGRRPPAHGPSERTAVRRRLETGGRRRTSSRRQPRWGRRKTAPLWRHHTAGRKCCGPRGRRHCRF
ncbi:solute carrier family 40 member 1-like [Pollicipes pollicipes]|uniref:solute carrier family 40 member 1-like n=1 Tax=Pollicipes pollicipes TaxID=41117 RepID=UPI001884B2C4|nr:solute carrier family 40 member 1-like [Pollicipes pollicipes]